MVTVSLSRNPNGRAVVVVLGIFLALDYIFVFFRYWARHLQRRELQFNDWTMLAALVLVTSLYGVEVAAVRMGGVGLHLKEIVAESGTATVVTAAKLVLVADILWNLSTLAIKMSILHLYITIFRLTSPKFRRTVWMLMAICVISTIVFIIQILALCHPFAFFWNKRLAGTCGSFKLSYLIPSIIIMIEDIAIFALPLPLLWNLKTTTKKKIGASFVFGIGFSICVIFGVRLKYAIELNSDDFTASMWMFAILGTTEPMLGIICACLPVVPTLVAHYSKDRIMAWSQKGSSVATRRFEPSVDRFSKSPIHREITDFERLSDQEYPLVTR